MTENEFKYWACLSYSQQDNRERRPDTQEVSSLCWGDWVHAALKAFSIPAEFVGQINGRGEIIPERIHPILQDEEELPEGTNLSAEIRAALEQSRCLIVICSPRSAKSLHVNEVVRYFKQLGRGKQVLPIVVAGEPNASDGNKPALSREDECFVPALRHPVQPDGSIDTTRRAGKFIFADARHGVELREILANDHRNAEADLETAKIQLIALLIGVAFHGLWWREQKRHFLDLVAAQHQAREALHQVEEAQRQLQEARRQTREAQHQVLETQNLPRDVHSQIQEAQTKAEEAQSQAREAQKQLQDFQNKVRDTQNQLEEARSRVLAAESKVLEAQNQARETRRQAEEAQRQVREASNQVQEVPDQIQETQREAEEARRQTQEARNQAGEAQHQVREVRREAEEAQRQLQEARSQVQALPGQIQEAQRQAEEARRQTQELQSQARQTLTQVRAAQQQAEAAQGKVQAAQNQIRQARRMTKALALVTLIALLAASIVWWQRKPADPALAKPVVDEAKADDLAQGKLDQEQIRQALQKFGATRPDGNQLLDELAARIPLAEIPEAMKASSIILEAPQRGHFQLAVLDHWMKTDLPDARDWVRQLPDGDSRPGILQKIIPALAADNPTNTLALLNAFKPVPGEESYALLFQRWAASDPVQAIQQRQAIPGQDADDKILCAILAGWMDQQPEAALNWVKAQPDSESKNKALETCIGRLAKTDVPRALALVEPLPAGDWRSTVMVGLFNDWAARDLVAATTACQQLPDGIAKAKAWEGVLSRRIAKDPASAAEDVKNLPLGGYRQKAIAELCQRWAGTNSLVWAQSLPSEAERVLAFNQVVANWAHQDPQAALQFADQHPELSGEALGEMAEALAKTDWTAATNWVANLSEGEKKDKALMAMSGTWVQSDPKGMATFALSLPAGAAQTHYLTAASRPLAMRDLPGTVELLMPLSDAALRQRLLEQAGRGGDPLHLNQAAKYISAMPAGEDQQAAIKGLLSSWTSADPESAVNWLGAFPETNAQPKLVSSVIKAWAQREPAAVAKWLANLPAGTSSEATVSAFLEGAVAKYPEFAGQWTQSVTNEPERQKFQIQVARQWMKTDPSAASKWINGLDFPEAIQQRIPTP